MESCIHKILCDLTQRSPFLAKVDDHSTAPLLRLLNRFFHAEDEVRPTRADITPEDVASVALVVDTQGESLRRVRHVLRVAEAVDRQAADGGKEYFDVGPCDEFWI